jgi:hypothetical protein
MLELLGRDGKREGGIRRKGIETNDEGEGKEREGRREGGYS